MKSKYNKGPIFFVFITTAIITGCGAYSYTDQVHFIPTVSIDLIKNHVKTGSSDINFKITEKLQEKINNQYDLKLVNKNGEITFKGFIKDYYSFPFSIGANNIAYLNRIELTVNVTVINNYEDQTVNKNIKAFVDYDARLNLGAVSDSLNEILTDRISENIFNEFFRNW